MRTAHKLGLLSFKFCEVSEKSIALMRMITIPEGEYRVPAVSLKQQEELTHCTGSGWGLQVITTLVSQNYLFQMFTGGCTHTELKANVMILSPI